MVDRWNINTNTDNTYHMLPMSQVLRGHSHECAAIILATTLWQNVVLHPIHRWEMKYPAQGHTCE